MKKPPSVRSALAMIFILLGVMVFAPSTLARCVHDAGVTHFHLLGEDCDDAITGADSCCSAAVPDEEDAGVPADAVHPGCCEVVQADDSLPAVREVWVPAAPLEFTPVFPAVDVEVSRLGYACRQVYAANAPPAGPPRDTHGAGARPILC